MIRVKLPISFGNIIQKIKHFIRSLRHRDSEETVFGSKKPGFLIKLQKRKWLWRLISTTAILFGLILVTSIAAYITMVMTIKGEEVRIPDLEGMTTTEAVEVLTELDLKLKIDEKRQYSKGIEEGKIIQQQPESGTSVKRNNSVKVVLSAGTRLITVPSMIGQSARNASAVFSDRGLNLHMISQVHSEFVVMNNIIAQEPAQGSELIRGSRVNILVSLGPGEKFFVMPDLIGKDYDMVTNQLSANGFRIGNTFHRYYPGAKKDTIIMQFPKAGYSVSKTDIINLWVSE
ncbi:MAG: PASTA domain-containing protein [Acidobacteria bacterium]|nr:PASTA domain-containing protein [Acidobacteriota bacterium]